MRSRCSGAGGLRVVSGRMRRPYATGFLCDRLVAGMTSWTGTYRCSRLDYRAVARLETPALAAIGKRLSACITSTRGVWNPVPSRAACTAGADSVLIRVTSAGSQPARTPLGGIAPLLPLSLNVCAGSKLRKIKAAELPEKSGLRVWAVFACGDRTGLLELGSFPHANGIVSPAVGVSLFWK